MRTRRIAMDERHRTALCPMCAAEDRRIPVFAQAEGMTTSPKHPLSTVAKQAKGLRQQSGAFVRALPGAVDSGMAAHRHGSSDPE